MEHDKLNETGKPISLEDILAAKKSFEEAANSSPEFISGIGREIKDIFKSDGEIPEHINILDDETYYVIGRDGSVKLLD